MKMPKWMRMGVIIVACGAALCFAADEEKETPGDAAWKEVLKALRPPPPPAEWRTNQPSKEQIAEYERKNGELAGKAADKAKDFHTKYPEHAKAKDARGMEARLLATAIELGATNRQAQLEALQESRLSDPALPADEKFNLRAQRIAKMVMDSEGADRAGTLEKAEKAARELQKEFPKRDEVNELLLMVAQGYMDLDLQKAQTLTEDLVKNSSGEAKEQAEAQLRKLNLVGKPLEISFTDLNGKEVSVKDYTGKVVLIYFWATWCGPCVAALPEVKEVYRKYHAKGFEIIGISFDKEKEKLTEFVESKEMPWPQYFDGLAWENKLGQRFQISAIPTVWLVDKKGILRDLNGRQSLAAKVEKFLAEK